MTVPSHLDAELLAAVDEGERSPESLLRAALDHLRDLSPEWAAALGRGLTREFPRQGPVAAALAVEWLGAAELGALRPGLAAAARRELAGLKKLTPHRRIVRLVRGRVRGANPLLIDALIAEAREALRKDPAEALAWLELGWTCHEILLGLGVPMELLAPRAARLSAHRANALRVASQLVAADAAFTRLHGEGWGEQVADPKVKAELASLEASLRQDQRRFEAAETLLGEAERLFLLAGDTEGLGKAQTKRGILLHLRGDAEAAVGVLERAARVLDPERHARAYLMTQHNLALAWLDRGEPRLASYLLDAQAQRYARFPEDSIHVPLRWVRGRIAGAVGDFAEAERMLEEVRAHYLEAGYGLDTALVSLDLAETALVQGRWADVRQIATEMEPLFAAHGVHREALAALLYFQRAAEGEAVTAVLVARFRRYLETSWNDPAACFEPTEPLPEPPQTAPVPPSEGR